MVECIARIGIAIALTIGSRLGFGPAFDGTWGAMLGWATLGTFAFLLQRRGLRAPWVSLLVTISDISAISVALAVDPALAPYRFLVLVPAAWGITRHHLHPALVAPFAALSLPASPLVLSGQFPSDTLIAQAVSVFVVALVVRPGLAIVEAEPEFASEGTHPSISADRAPLIERDETLMTSYLGLRERFRSLRDHYQNLERRAKKDRATVQLIEAARAAPAESVQSHITQTLRELCGVTGASLYCTAQYGDSMVVRATSGELPHALATSSVPVSSAWSERNLRTNFDQWLRALRVDDQTSQARSVVLRHQGQIVGVICLADSDPERLQRAVSAAEDWSNVVAAIIAEQESADRTRRRLKEAEMLYAICSVSVGATTPVSIAARVVRELWGSVRADHIGISFLDDDRALAVATQGAHAQLLDALQFGPYGKGMMGWLTANSPEVAIFDTTDDDRIAKRDALQKRVGSYILIPIRSGDAPRGFLTAATHRVGGLDIPDLETLRIVAAELSQALSRLESNQPQSGLATPTELQQAISAGNGGCLVVLEPLRADAIVAEFGQPAYDHALRAFARKIRTTLPSGALLCRRQEGDYVALLASPDENAARSWANEAATLASMTGVTTPDGSARIPLAFRTKVSTLAAAAPVEAGPKVVKAVFPRVSRQEVA